MAAGMVSENSDCYTHGCEVINLRKENIKLKEMMDKVKLWLHSNPLDWLLDAQQTGGQDIKQEILEDAEEHGELKGESMGDPLKPDLKVPEDQHLFEKSAETQIVLIEERGNKNIGGSKRSRSPSTSSKKTKYQCNQCEYISSMSYNLQEHEATHQQVIEKSTEIQFVLTEERGEEGTSLVLQPASSKETHVTSENEHGKTGNPDIVGSKRSRTLSTSSQKTKYHRESKATTPQRHKETKHEGIRYPCDECKYAAKRVFDLKRHKEYKHEGIRFPCEYCDFSAITTSSLKVHIRTKHEGILYHCDQCEFAATTMGNLKVHIRSKHEGILYSCDKCEFSATRPTNLKAHIRSKHEGIRYSCDYCEYDACRKEKLRRHIKKVHKQT